MLFLSQIIKIQCNQILPFMRLYNRCRFQSTNSVNHTDNYSDNQYDIIIVGGGIVGLATAQQLMQRLQKKETERSSPLRVCLVEKEGELAMHQSGHNSGVIHAGIYYAPGSLKARLCVQGLRRSYEYCDTHAIPYRKCGKLIVARNSLEVERLHNLMGRGQENGVPGLRMLNSTSEIREVEPNCTGGIAAIHSPETGIVDWQCVARSYGNNFRLAGGKILLNYELGAIQQIDSCSDDTVFPIQISRKSASSQLDHALSCRFLVTCAGLHSDRASQMSGGDAIPKIVPFRGDYLVIDAPTSTSNTAAHPAPLVSGNIYPVPDPSLPFLGVHFTPRLDGSVWLGPSALPALGRECYGGATQFNARDLAEMLRFPGMWRLSVRYLRFGLGELHKAASLSRQIRELQSFVPSLLASEVRRGPCGIRAQAMDSAGHLVDDFIMEIGGESGRTGNRKGVGGREDGSDDMKRRILHVRNAPSPAATSSLPIADMIVDKILKQYQNVIGQ